jgi:hypothetical protein
LVNSDAEVDINTAQETIRENIKISVKESLGYYKLQHKPRFDERRSKLLAKRKLAKFQWLQNPREISGNKLNNIRCEASRHFRHKRREYLKDKINETAMYSNNNNIKDVYRKVTNLEVT